MKFIFTALMGVLVPASWASYTIPKGAVTQAKLAPRTYYVATAAPAGGILQSASISYNVSSTATPTLSSATSAITTTGRPVMLMLAPYGAVSNASIAIGNSGGNSASASILFKRDGTTYVCATANYNYQAVGATAITFNLPTPVTCLDVSLSAGSHTYQVEVTLNSGTGITLSNMQITAFEI